MKIKTYLRKLLGTPFSVSRAINPLVEEYNPIGDYEPRLREDNRLVTEPIFKRFFEQRWRYAKFTYVAKGPILLDTSLGWGLSGLKILYYSNTSLFEQVKNPPKPNILKWLQNRNSATYYPEVVWMPYGLGNYWHCLNDFIGSIYLLQDLIKERQPVVLIHESLAKAPFFKEMVSYSTVLSALNFKIYTADKWVRCDELITARTYFGNRESFQDAISLFDKMPPITVKPSDKIFISRAAGLSRAVGNIDEINDYFIANGFKIVLFEKLSVLEQATVVNTAKVIVALHGAGMANLAFHKNPAGVKIVEITPDDYVNPCFAYLTEEMGMDYHCYGAEPRNPQNNFNYKIPLEGLDELLKRLDVV